MMKFKLLCLLAVIFFVFSERSYTDEFIIDEPPSGEKVKVPEQKSSYGVNSQGDGLKRIGSVPTPITFGKGEFYGEFSMYENGGIGTRFVVGIFDILEIGFTENIDHLIGSDSVGFNIPGAYLKLTILKNFRSFYWAIGFDSFGYGINASFVYPDGKCSTIYGFFTTFGWPYSFFGGKDFLSFGIRYPLLPVEAQNVSNSSLFLGLSISAPEYFSMGLTLENIYLSFDRGNRILPSLIFTLKPVREFIFNFILQYEFYSQRLNRILSIGYETKF